MKKFFTLIGAMLLTITASAQSQTTLKITPFSIEPGETKTVTLDLYNPDFEVAGFSCGILLPEGLNIAKNKKDKYNITLNTEAERYDDHTVSADLNPDGTVTIVCFSISAATFWGTEGAILNIPFTASATASGTLEVQITKQDITGPNGEQVKPETYVVPVTIGSTSVKEVEGNGASNGDGKYLKNGKLFIKKGNKEFNAVGSILK